MASSRRLPTSYNTSTFGGVTRDYQSLAVWEAATDNDLVTAAKGEVLDCYADSVSYDQTVLIIGAITNTSYFRVIRAASGEGHSGVPGSGVQFIHNEDGIATMFSVNEDYAQVQDLVITMNGNSATSRFTIRVISSGINNVGIIGCLVKNLNSGAGSGYGYFCSAASSYQIVNTLMYECKTDGILQTSGTGYIYNCTVVDNADDGIDFDGGTMTVKNCVAQGNGGDDIEGSPTQVTNVTSGVLFQDAAADNYLLSGSDTAAKNQGTDLSSDANYPFDDDVIYTTRPQETDWDIGFNEYKLTAIPTGNSGGFGVSISSNVFSRFRPKLPFEVKKRFWGDRFKR